MDDLELQRLEREAAQIDAELNQQDHSETAAQEVISLNASYRGAILKFLGFAVGIVNERVSFTRQHFTGEALENIADSLIKVADVEGLDLNKLIGDPDSRIGAWFALAFSIGMPSFTFWLALQEYKKQTPAEPKPEPKQPAPKPADDTGALMPAMQIG